MVKLRSIVVAVLALAFIVLLNFGSVAEAKPKPQTYTGEQIEQIQSYTSELSALRDRLPELAALIQKQDWIFTRNFIHGPLGELRTKMLNVSRYVLPDAQPRIRAAAKLVFDNLVAIDEAAEVSNYKAAIRNYAETVRDFDAFLQLLPKAS